MYQAGPFNLNPTKKFGSTPIQRGLSHLISRPQREADQRLCRGVFNTGTGSTSIISLITSSLSVPLRRILRRQPRPERPTSLQPMTQAIQALTTLPAILQDLRFPGRRVAIAARDLPVMNGNWTAAVGTLEVQHL